MYRLNPGIVRAQGQGVIKSLAPAAWYRYGQGITVATGVSTWADQSGNGRDLSQGTTTAQPAKQADGSILFDGVSDFLQSGAFTVNQPLTVYVLGKMVAWGANTYILNGRSAITEPGLRMSTSTPNVDASAGSLGPQESDLAVGTYGVISAIFNGASSSMQVNNGTVHTGNAGTNGLAGLTLGAAVGTPAQGWGNVQLKEVIVFGAAHSTSQRFEVTRYLSEVGQLGL